MKTTLLDARTLLRLSAAGMALWAASPALAADPAPAPASAAASDAGDIIVTAQRRSERQQDVPITISSFSGVQLSQAGVQSLSDIDKLTSGVRFDKRTNFVVPTIRGITTPIVLAGGGSNIGVYIDGFYAPALQSADMQLLNVSNVEVLKGPQGTLFGRNTNGGAILVNSTDPSEQPSAIAEVGYGNYNALRLQGYATMGLAKGVAFDAAGSYTSGDGYVTNIADGDNKVGAYHNYSLRFGLKLTPTDNLTILARYEREDVRDPTNLLQVPYLLGGTTPASTFATKPGVILATQPGQISDDAGLRFHFVSDVGQLKVALDLGRATLTSYTQYRTDIQSQDMYSFDYTNLPGADINIPDSTYTFTQELLLNSKGSGPLQYTAGVFYFDSVEKYPGVGYSSLDGPFNIIAASGVHNKSIAGYANATYEVLPKLFLTGGLRYTSDRVEDAWYKGLSNPLPTLTTSRVTPRAVIRYALDNRSSVYASYSAGYKAAIYNVGGNSSTSISPEALDAFEVGYKHDTRVFSANVSSYYYNYRNQQVTNGILSCRLVNNVEVCVPLTAIRNAASSHMYGIEGDFHLHVTPAFEINGSAGWSHDRFHYFPSAPRFDPANSYAVVYDQDATGKHMLRAPDFSGNVGVSYKTDVARGELLLSGNVYYTSTIYFDVFEQLPQKAYATLGLHAEWTDPSGRYTLGLTGKNVTNTKYYTQAASNAFGVAAIWAAPAMVEGSIRVKLP